MVKHTIKNSLTGHLIPSLNSCGNTNKSSADGGVSVNSIVKTCSSKAGGNAVSRPKNENQQQNK